MVLRCVVLNCKSFWSPACEVIFHRFPTNKNRREKWLAAVPLKNKFYETAAVCSLHFKEDDYSFSNPSRLLATACPSYFLQTPFTFGSQELQDVNTSTQSSLPASADYVDSDADSVITDEEDAQVPAPSNKAKAARTVVTDNASEGETSISLYHDATASRKQAKEGRAAQSGAAHDIICDECGNSVTGFRYACVQCADYDLCAACEAAGAHAQHYVLRIPRPTPHMDIMNLLRKIRTELESCDLLSNPGDTDVKVENTEAETDPVPDPLAAARDIKIETPEISQEELAVQSIMQPESSASSILLMALTDTGTYAPSGDAKPARSTMKRPQPTKTDQKQAKERKVLPPNRKLVEIRNSFRGNIPVATPRTSSRMPRQRAREPSSDSGGFISEVFTHRIKDSSGT